MHTQRALWERSVKLQAMRQLDITLQTTDKNREESILLTSMRAVYWLDSNSAANAVPICAACNPGVFASAVDTWHSLSGCLYLAL